MPAPTNAQVHHSKPSSRKRTIRTAKVGTARAAIGALEPGAELFCLTFGQFSLIDVIVAVLEQTGPADVIISTWTAANADLTTAAQLLENASINRLRFVVDRSFATRQPAYCAKMRAIFGDGCIRTTRSHAKFVTIRNDKWTIALRTSMNLNSNPRLENFEISDDPALCSFFESVVETLFDEMPTGEFNGDLPALAGVTDHSAPPRIEMGHASAGV